MPNSTTDMITNVTAQLSTQQSPEVKTAAEKSALIKLLGGAEGIKGEIQYGLSGSSNLLSIPRPNGINFNILVDFGVHHGKNSTEMNNEIPFDPAEIDLVVITHAHMDHLGRLPMLVSRGFKGKVLMHDLIRKIAKIMLEDSAEIMLKNSKWNSIETRKQKTQLLSKLRLLNIVKSQKDSQSEDTGEIFQLEGEEVLYENQGKNKLALSHRKEEKRFARKNRKKKNNGNGEQATIGQLRKDALAKANYQEYEEDARNIMQIGISEGTFSKNAQYSNITLLIDFLWEEIENQRKNILSKKHRIKRIIGNEFIRQELKNQIEDHQAFIDELITFQDFFIEKKQQLAGTPITNIYLRIEELLEHTKKYYDENFELINGVKGLKKYLKSFIETLDRSRYFYYPFDLLKEKIEQIEQELIQNGISTPSDIQRIAINEKIGRLNKILYYKDDVDMILSKQYAFSKSGGIKYNEYYEVSKGVYIKLIDSGHIVGGSQVFVKADFENEDSEIYGFSSDIGRFENKHSLLTPQIFDEEVKSFIIESTYGDRVHPPIDKELLRFIDAINEIHKEKGKIIIPSFMLQRLQEVSLLLLRLKYYGYNGKFIPPNIPLYINGKRIDQINSIFANSGISDEYKKLLDRELIYSKKKSRGTNEFSIIRNRSAIMLAPAGMLTGGPIMQHINNAFLENARNAVFFVGYCGEETLGRAIMERRPWYLPGIGTLNVRARLEIFKSFSNHGDQNDLAHLISNMEFTSGAKIIVNHGEGLAPKALAQILDTKARLGRNFEILTPSLGEEIVI